MGGVKENRSAQRRGRKEPARKNMRWRPKAEGNQKLAEVHLKWGVERSTSNRGQEVKGGNAKGREKKGSLENPVNDLLVAEERKGII